jgi:hypothetical protein
VDVLVELVSNPEMDAKLEVNMFFDPESKITHEQKEIAGHMIIKDLNAMFKTEMEEE